MAEDGTTVLCRPTADAPCDLEAIMAAIKAQDEVNAAAQAEVDAAAQAEVDAAAQAEADATAQAGNG